MAHITDGTDDEPPVCPLCCEEFDLSDLSFYPCKCGYQICMWCWHKIKETESKKCPACRTEYGDDPFEFEELEVDEVMKFEKERKEREKEQRQAQTNPTQGGANPKAQLGNMRVIRRNLVYCVGLPANMSQSILASEKVRCCEERSDYLRRRVYWISTYNRRYFRT